MTAVRRPPALPGAGADLDAVLVRYLRRDLSGTLLADRDAVVVFQTVEGDAWTVRLAGGHAVPRRGRAERAALVVQSPADLLAAVITGRASAVDAFLSGELTMRGDLALCLQLDGLFLPAEDRPASHPRARCVQAMGVRTCYLEAGDPSASPVVLLHGLGATNASMLPVLADLARDHRVLAPDMPGFGASSAPHSLYNSAWFAAWVAAFQSATRSRGAVLVGNSLGGRVALEAGLEHPRQVRGLILLTPSPAFRRLRQLVPLVRVVNPRIARLPVPPVSHRLVVAGIRALMSVPDRLPDAWYDAAADECVRVLRSPAHRSAFLAASRQIYLEEAQGRAGFWNRLPGLLPPALFVWGDRDRLVPSSFARHVAAALPHAASIVMEDCGHAPQFEHPAETMTLIRGFLDTLPS